VKVRKKHPKTEGLKGLVAAAKRSPWTQERWPHPTHESRNIRRDVQSTPDNPKLIARIRDEIEKRSERLHSERVKIEKKVGIRAVVVEREKAGKLLYFDPVYVGKRKKRQISAWKPAFPAAKIERIDKHIKPFGFSAEQVRNEVIGNV
jgi:hypothetical protein